MNVTSWCLVQQESVVSQGLRHRAGTGRGQELLPLHLQSYTLLAGLRHGQS